MTLLVIIGAAWVGAAALALALGAVAAAADRHGERHARECGVVLDVARSTRERLEAAESVWGHPLTERALTLRLAEIRVRNSSLVLSRDSHGDGIRGHSGIAGKTVRAARRPGPMPLRVTRGRSNG